PRFRERHMKEGLHLWYVVTFNPETPVTKAHSGFSGNSNIENVEYVPVSVCQEVVFPFDDPRLLDQWHYHNWGEYSYYKAGMDINLLKAWEIETGSESVIVAVVDGGVDYLHPDLADAMWINEAEKSGIPGVDDDNNGYVDDIYGCDLVTKTGDILPEEHGTHVAGIIGAINNNGQFGAGIAGGKNGKGGVRIMSCQMFKGEQQAGGASGIVYAADNGAVICNNSWGFIDPDVVSQYTKDAIDYFNKYAGLDADGNQVGAMAGGITIFAAGNDNSQKASPAMYEGVVAVANIDYGGIKASTSNYGEWIDITAPGRIIGSTLPDGGFGFMSGTSMACPHVSGVAALVVSKYGGYGFTGQMLRERILRAADYNKAYDNNPEYIGQLGAGMVDAYMSLMSNSLPYPVGDIDAQVSANIIALTWNATDNNGESVYGYNIYVSKTDLSGYNPEEGNIKPIFVPGESFKPQDVVSYTLTGLEYSTQYYIRIEAVNYFMMGAPLSPQIKVKTKDNQPPVITPGEDISVTLKAQEEIDFRFTVSDPESNAMSYKLTPGSAAVMARSAEDVITVYIEAVKAEAGTYTAILTVSDELGASSSVKITYTILPNNPPVKVKEIENVSLGKGEQVSIDLSQYFTDSDGE
ncbi:MAG: S8 family serine peptidase, partial [Bacteroidales bacterium]|nr:S8 family serine peptidase [Bacteroidales bacterium]